VCPFIRLNIRTELSEEDIEAIDEAGARGALHFRFKVFGKRLALAAALGALALGFSFISGVDLVSTFNLV
jgi:hypothetical protein